MREAQSSSGNRFALFFFFLQTSKEGRRLFEPEWIGPPGKRTRQNRQENRRKAFPMTINDSNGASLHTDDTELGAEVKHVFLDVETSGLTSFDCILSYALVATDAAFNLVSQTAIPVGRPPHIVPHPKALLVNKADLGQIDLWVRPREAFAYLADALAGYACEGVTFWAHNMPFDLRFVREQLFTNLCDPYVMSKKGAGLADTLTMARVIATVDPGALDVPVIESKPSFRLGPLLRGNGVEFDEAIAHDALADCYGARDLARMLHERSPAFFAHMLSMARRDHVLGFLDENPLFRHFAHFGEARYPISKFVTFGAEDRNAAVVIDLSVDPAPVLAMSAEELAETMATSPRSLSVIRLNAMPALLPVHAIKALDEPDDYTLSARATAVSLADGFEGRIQEALRIRAASFLRSPHVEQQLFDSFPSAHDNRLRNALHAAATPEQRANLALHFEDVRLRAHAKRLVHAETPELLPAHEREAMDAWLADRLLTQDAVPWLTLHQACSELAGLRPTLTDENGEPRPAKEDEQALLDRIDAIEAYYLGLAAGLPQL